MAITVRGKFYSYSSVTNIIDGEEMPNVSSFDYGIKKNGSYVKGSDMIPMGTTDGDGEFSASLKMPREAWVLLQERLGDNYMQVELNWLIAFGKNGAPTQKVEIKKFTIIEEKSSGAAGSSDALEVDLTIMPTEIISNGKRAFSAR